MPRFPESISLYSEKKNLILCTTQVRFEDLSLHYLIRYFSIRSTRIVPIFLSSLLLS
jgi:hypothetical protein